MSLSPAICPSSVIQGSTHTFMGTITGGTFPVIGVIKVDGSVVKTGLWSNQSFYDLDYNFPEAAGNHTYRLELTDSCPVEIGGPMIAYDECIINIVLPCPSMTVEIIIS